MRWFYYEDAARFLTSPADCLWKKQHTVLLIITTAPNKPKVGVSEGIQNKHSAPQCRLAYFKKQSKMKTSWRQPAEQKEPAHLCCFLWTRDIRPDVFVFYSFQWHWKGLCMCLVPAFWFWFLWVWQEPSHCFCLELLFFLKMSCASSGWKNDHRIPTHSWSSRLAFSFFSTSPDNRALLTASSRCLQTHQLKNEWWISDALTWTVLVVQLDTSSTCGEWCWHILTCSHVRI